MCFLKADKVWHNMGVNNRMKINSHINSFFNSVSYLLNSTLVDVGDKWMGFGNIKYVLLTHAHFDHIYGLNELSLVSPQISVFTNQYGKDMLLDAKKNLSLYHEKDFIYEHPENIIVVENEDDIFLGNDMTAKAIFTPGHNPSCITWVVDDMIFTGDSYIPGIKTVTNLPGGDKKAAVESEKLILQLAQGRIIYPGHKI